MGRKHSAPTTDEAREAQLVSLAMDLAEQQLREGTAPAQVVTHFLRAGATREKLEQERLRQENIMIAQKIEQIASQRRVDELYIEAMEAFRTYQPTTAEIEENPYHD